ncbi:thymidylate synthase [Planobispora rosea]|uniref:Thymidylate synthase n=1 Tax=Planobispora rosea TaxID=35762 RepID=A0A8J3WGR3_PLARO|nr:thymidylate synthase [Planobispora rosea]GGS98895.1 thymidylate synthase [Planobispora rosea]GIH87992.1 thymidylate synthase [Planobispora rosea]
MQPPVFATFHDAYRAVLELVSTHPQHETSTRGNHSRERLNVSFTLADPRHRTPALAARRTNIVFNYAEVLWYLSGRDDVEMIGYYAPRLRTLAADGRRLTGTAYGPRLFAPRGDSQFDRALELLGKDPDSKRAAMTIMRPGEFADPANPDVACTLAVQFLIRAGHLHTVVFMRGNDALIGLLCDVFSFTFLAEFAALQLGVGLGTYTHHVASMHLNTPDLPQAQAILAEPAAPPAPAEAMPVGTTWTTVAQILHWEEQLRAGRCALTAAQVAALPLEPYWQQVVLLWEVYRQITHQGGQPITAEVLAALTPQHRWLIACRWPDRLPSTGERR